MTNPDLLAKFTALREFVEGIPPEKLDMRVCSSYDVRHGLCGCVIAHGEAASVTPYDSLNKVITKREWRKLFDGTEIGYPRSTYPEPTGLPAKTEFLRRLDALKEKYCGT